MDDDNSGSDDQEEGEFSSATKIAKSKTEALCGHADDL
jgi:hypothetical protein